MSHFWGQVNGNFYGTTYAGGSAGAGVVFIYNPSTAASVTFSSSSSGTVSGSTFVISGQTLTLNLSYAPEPGDVLTVLNNSGGSPISGTYSNLPEGGTLSASYGGNTYMFTASYQGGANGNSLTLTYLSSGPGNSVDTSSSDGPVMPPWMLILMGVMIMGIAGWNLKKGQTA